MRGCDECGNRKGCTTRKLLRAVERECGVSVGVDGCDYRDNITLTGCALGHQWECVGSSTGGSIWRCRVCGKIATTTVGRQR